MKTDHEYIWISRWEEFQHYPPDRDRAPAWIKTYTKQLSDDRYRDLTSAQRALLHDLRIELARSHGRLTSEPRRLTQRLGMRVTSAQLTSLNHAGFIEFLSRESLELALEKFYTSRARDRAHHGDVEAEEEQEQEQNLPAKATASVGATNGAHPPAVEIAHSLEHAGITRSSMEDFPE